MSFLHFQLHSHAELTCKFLWLRFLAQKYEAQNWARWKTEREAWRQMWIKCLSFKSFCVLRLPTPIPWPFQWVCFKHHIKSTEYLSPNIYYLNIRQHGTILTKNRHSVKRCYERKGGEGVRNKVGSLPKAGEYKTAPPGFSAVEGTWVFCFR